MNRPFKLSICFSAMLAAACVAPGGVRVPATLEPGSNEALAMIVPAKGVQIYECRAKNATADPEWVFVAPDAELLNTRGRPIGRHGAGPYWEASDGSRVQASLKARADAPVAGAIPWLLLTARSVGAEGSFSQVSSIQRVNTVGGAAPANGCDRTTLGKAARVPYTADYVFFSQR